MIPGMLGFGSGVRLPPPEPKPETLVEKAERVIRDGKEKEAFDYLYASMLVDDSSDLLGKYRWSNALKRPVLAVRWGIGVDVTVSPKNYEGSYYPLGSNQNLPDRSRRGGNRGNRRGGTGGGYSRPSTPSSGGGSGRPPGMGMGSGGGYPGRPGGPAGTSSQPDMAVVTEAAGDLADGFVKRVREGIDSGDYGEALVQLIEAARRPAPAGGRAGGYANGSYPGGRYGSGGSPPGMGASRFSRWLSATWHDGFRKWTTRQWQLPSAWHDGFR